MSYTVLSPLLYYRPHADLGPSEAAGVSSSYLDLVCQSLRHTLGQAPGAHRAAHPTALAQHWPGSVGPSLRMGQVRGSQSENGPGPRPQSESRQDWTSTVPSFTEEGDWVSSAQSGPGPVTIDQTQRHLAVRILAGQGAKTTFRVGGGKGAELDIQLIQLRMSMSDELNLLGL